jgi:hypothetical protein
MGAMPGGFALLKTLKKNGFATPRETIAKPSRNLKSETIPKPR